MNGKTQLALVGAQVVAHEVGVFVEVDRLERQLAQALASHLHNHTESGSKPVDSKEARQITTRLPHLVFLRLGRLATRPGLSSPPHHICI